MGRAPTSRRRRLKFSASSKSTGWRTEGRATSEDTIGRLNHVAIAVHDLDKATALYRDTLGAKVSAPVPLPGHRTTVVVVELASTQIELLEPLGSESTIRTLL